MHRLMKYAGTAGAFALLCGCASMMSANQAAAERSDRFAAYAGQPIDHFVWLGRFDSWQALGKNELVVFTNPSEAYILKVWAPCDMNLAFTRVGLTSSGGAVYARTDSVTVDAPGTGRWTCPIEEIRKVDYRQMRADLRAEAQANRAARESSAAQ
jgi:hypothetical protein